MRLLITGCSGFFASSMCQTAARNGYSIVGIGRSGRPPGWQGDYVERSELSTFDDVIRDYAPAAIFHMAGPSSVGSSFVAPLEDFQSGVVTWVNTLESVRRSGLKPVIFFPSSAAVYGNPRKLPVSENEILAPISPYGFHKVSCELLGREYSECFGLHVTIARFFSTFGVGQQRLLIWEIFQQLDGPGNTVELDGTGTETRDYLEVGDAMAAVLEIVRTQASTIKVNERGKTVVINVASGEERNVLDIANQLRLLVAPEKKIRCRGSERRGDPRAWRADIQRLRSLATGWQAKPFALALSQCVAAWRKTYSSV